MVHVHNHTNHINMLVRFSELLDGREYCLKMPMSREKKQTNKLHAVHSILIAFALISTVILYLQSSYSSSSFLNVYK